MNKANRDKYLGAPLGCLPSALDPEAVATPQELSESEVRNSAKTEDRRERSLLALNANLACQDALFKMAVCEVRHISKSNIRKKRLYCD